jgi:hypothetical protein
MASPAVDVTPTTARRTLWPPSRKISHLRGDPQVNISRPVISMPATSHQFLDTPIGGCRHSYDLASTAAMGSAKDLKGGEAGDGTIG